MRERCVVAGCAPGCVCWSSAQEAPRHNRRWPRLPAWSETAVARCWPRPPWSSPMSATGISVTTRTNADGIYTVPSLRPGDYSVTVERPGFNRTSAPASPCRWRRSRGIDVTLQTGQRHRSRSKWSAATPLLRDARPRRAGSVIDQQQDRRPAAERPRLQPARAAVARRAARHAAAGQRQLQGRAQRQRQPHVQQRVPARRRRQHLVLELVPRRERAAGAAVDRGAAGVQDPDQRLFGGVRPQLRRGRQRDDQVGHQHAARQRLRVPAQRRARRQQLLLERARRAQAEAQAQPVRRRGRRPARQNRTFWFADYEGLRDQEGIPRVRLVPTAAEKAGLFSTAVVDPFAAGRPEFSRTRRASG